MNVRNFYIHALVVMAIVMVGISPACAFISGKGSIQICAPDGSVQVIEVDAAFDPFVKPMPLSEHLETMEQCSYCFAMGHHQYGDMYSQDVSLSVLPGYLVVSSGVAVPIGAQLSYYQSRGPPKLS